MRDGDARDLAEGGSVKAIPPADAEVLKWCGALGHTIVIVVDDVGKDGYRGRRCFIEMCDLQRAKRIVMGYEDPKSYGPAQPSAIVYEQVKRGKWRLAWKPPAHLSRSA